MNSSLEGIDKLNLNQVKQILFALNGTFKKLNLYFENHAIYQNALLQLKKSLDAYLNAYGELRLDIQRDAILCGQEKVHDGKLELNDLFYILFRDGILWLSFQTGLELWELDAFYKIAHKHIVLEDTAEDDVVTELWEYDLHGIQYEAADLDLGAMDVFDDPDLRRGLTPDETPSEDNLSSSAREDEAAINKYADLMESDDIWELTDAEREDLRKMIAEDEKIDGTDYVIEVLLYILRQLDKPGQDIGELLDTLTQEIREAALNGRFIYFWQVLHKLKQYHKEMQADNHWSAPYLQRFFAALAKSSFLGILARVSPQVEHCDPEERSALKNALLLLDASAVLTLAPLLLEIKTTQAYKLLMATIGIMANRNFSYLDRLLASEDPELVRRLVPILGHLKDQASRQTLSRLLSHGSAAVRMQAFMAVMTRDSQALQEVFKLVDDPDESVRNLLLNHLGRERHLQAEALLLNYLKNQQRANHSSGDLIPTYQALGRCGSDQSIPFLQGELFKWPSLGVLRSRRSLRRKGAQVALRALKTPAALSLINRQASGFFKNIFRRT